MVDFVAGENQKKGGGNTRGMKKEGGVEEGDGNIYRGKANYYDLMDTLAVTLKNVSPSRFMELCQCSYLLH
jgi:hypothetical protein